MAIKGKKKSQSRGSQARRRPAAAPRSLGPGRRRPPWYKTPQGRTAIIALLIVVAAVVTGVVLKARSNSAKLADRQQAFENYTGSVRAVLQTLSPVAAEMGTAPTDAKDREALSDLPEKAKEWTKGVEDSIDQLVALRPPARATLVQSFLQQSSQLYLSAARLYETVGEEAGPTRSDLLTETTTLRDQANGLFLNAVALLDEYRRDLDMPPSALRAPASAPVDLQPSPFASIPVESEAGEGEGHDHDAHDHGFGRGKKGGKKGSKKGSG